MFYSSEVRVYFLLINSIKSPFHIAPFFHKMRNGKYYFLGATLLDAILQNVTSSKQQTFIKLSDGVEGIFLWKIGRLLYFLEATL